MARKVSKDRNKGKPFEKKEKKESENIKMEGVIIETLPNTSFLVELDNGHKLLTYISGKMRMNYIKLTTGDRVVLEISPYDTTRGRIIYRKG